MKQKILVVFILAVVLAASAAALPSAPNSPSSSSLPTSNIVIVPTLIVDAAIPLDNTAKRPGTVVFTATLTNTSKVTSCSLLLNGTTVKTGAPVGEAVELSQSFSSSQEGHYAWIIRCTDGTLTNSSVSRIINISSSAVELQGLTMSLDDDEYLPGEKIKITVSDLTPLADNVTIRIGSLHTTTQSASLSGIITYTYTLSFDVSADNYTVDVLNKNNYTQNASATFTVPVPNASLSLSKDPALPGDKVKIYGKKFLSSKKAHLLIVDGATILLDKNITLTFSGKFSYYFDVPLIFATNLTISAELHNNTEYFAEVNLEIGALTTYPDNTTNTTDDDDEDDEDDSDTNTSSSTTTTGSSGTGSSGTGSTDTTTTTGTSNTGNIPDFRDYDDYDPSPKKGGFSFWWLLIPLLIGILIAGGFLGFVAYEGYFDTSSPEAFIDGCKNALGLGTGASMSASSASEPMHLPGDTHPDGSLAGASGFPASGGQSVQVSEQEFSQLSNFINGERGKGYDDLTIRNALLEKGWAEPEVDGVFDKMYETH